VLGEGNLWVTELVITYDGRPVNVVTIMEFKDGKVAHETHYYADPFEPPEAEIIAWLDSKIWSNELSRRTQHYGFEYNYRTKALTLSVPLEGHILEFAQILEKTGLMKPVQCIANEYYRNQGIAPHIDHLKFGPVIVGLSLESDVVMVFERGIERFECFLPRRSVMILSREARYEWKHSIEKKVTYIDNSGTEIVKPQDYRRISLTYRELA